MAEFYYSQNDKGGKLALANANRILSATAFENTVKQHIGPSGADLARDFGLINDDLDFPKMGQVHEHGDIALATVDGEEQQADWFVKTSGVWKQDITPLQPFTATQRAQDMEEDSVSVDRITAEIAEGRIKTPVQVRDALGQAMLNAQPNDVFVLNALRLENEPLPMSHDRPDPHGQFPSSPTTPAGAMNRFVQAVQGFDEATLRDVLYAPEDKDGAYRAAAARAFVAGMHFLQAAESKFPVQEDSDRICFWLGAVPRDPLREYTDDEWRVEPGYPDMAMSSWAMIPKTVMSNGKSVFVHEMGGAPIMHHCPDGVWRIGPRFPTNARRLHAEAIALAAKDSILEKAATDIRAGKYATDVAVIQAIKPKLNEVGASSGPAGF